MSDLRFQPAWWARGAHRQTIFMSKGRAPQIPEPVEILHAPIGGRGLLRIKLSRPQATPRGTMLIAHGMAGSAESAYVRWMASVALDRGWCVARVDLRGCGGTEALSRDLHNACQSEDIGSCLEELSERALPRPFAAVGFSLGGNLILRYLGWESESALADQAVAISPPVDLTSCSHALGTPGNFIYRNYFLRRLFRLVRRGRQHFEISGPALSPWRIRTLWRFDELFTAPNAGFDSVEQYYATASSGPTLGGVRRPTLILAAKDDPFVPIEMFDACRDGASSHVKFLHPSRGGHVGFLQAADPRFWAAEAVVSFLDSQDP